MTPELYNELRDIRDAHAILVERLRLAKRRYDEDMATRWRGPTPHKPSGPEFSLFHQSLITSGEPFERLFREVFFA